MKALSIRPAWAHAITHLGKRVENRTWRTTYRGPILIHASSTMRPEDIAALEAIVGRKIDVASLHRGAIVAIADLVDCVDAAKASSKWTFGPIAWRLRNVRPLKHPVQASGKLGLWQPGVALLRQVSAALTLDLH